MSSTMPHVFFARRVGLKRKDCGVRLKGVLVEQDSKVHVVGVCSEEIRDVRDMVTGFLKNNCMEPTAGGRGQCWKDFCALGLDSTVRGKGEIDDA